MQLNTRSHTQLSQDSSKARSQSNLRAAIFHRRTTMRLLASLLLLLMIGSLAACATPDQVSELEQELAASQARIDALTQELAELQHEHEEEHGHDHSDEHEHAEHGTANGEAIAAGEFIYAFAPEKISIIDPASAQVVHEITEGLAGVDWADARVIPEQQRIFANDRAGAQVVVIDTETHTIETMLDVGPRPVHAYAPRGGSEIWTHSDEEGAFYIIDAETLEVPARVVAALQDTGHGKLLYHPNLGNKAYATNTNDPAVFVIDLESREMIEVVELCEGEGGTHAKAYTAGNGFAYFECSALGQTAVVDTETDTLAGYLDGAGQLFESPDGSFAVIMNKAQNLVQVIDGENEPTIMAEIAVEGGADQIAFYAHDDSFLGFTANTQSPDSAIIDFSTMTLHKKVAAGDILRPEGALFLHRSGIVGGRYFITPASGDGVVAIIDAEQQSLHAAVPVGVGVNQVAYVDNSDSAD